MKTIIEMAREAGGLGFVHDAGDDPSKWQFTPPELKAFAALVRADEREVCGVPMQMEQPTQRTWVGLTDEEIDVIDEATWDEDDKSWGIHDFARAIEQRLKEKNA